MEIQTTEVKKTSKPEDKLKAPVSIVLIIGVFMKIFESPYGPIVFTIGFAGYFILKLIKIFRVPKYEWTGFHYLQLILVLVSMGALYLLYGEYPYSRAIFIVALLLESLVNLKIMINKYVGKENFNSILSFLGKLIRR